MTKDIILCKQIKYQPNKYCIFEICKKRSSFNFEGEKTALYCSIHKKENMIDVRSKNVYLKDVK